MLSFVAVTAQPSSFFISCLVTDRLRVGSSAGRLVRVLRTIVQMPMPAMFHSWEDLSLGSSLAL